MEFTNVKAFAEASTDLHDAIKEYAAERIKERKGIVCFTQRPKREMEVLIDKAFAAEVSRLSGVELPNLEKKSDVLTFAGLTSVKEMAEITRNVMIDAIIPDYLIDSPLNYIADIQYADYGDSIKFELKSNQLLTVSKAGNRQRNTNVQKTYSTDVTMSGENHEITVQTDLYQILVGRSHIAEDVVKAVEALEADMLYSAYDAFIAAMGTLTGSALEVANYSQDSLIHLCEVVGAWNGGAKPIILGTPIALSKVVPANTNYRYFLDSDYVKMGHVNTFFTKIYLSNAA